MAKWRNNNQRSVSWRVAYINNESEINNENNLAAAYGAKTAITSLEAAITWYVAAASNSAHMATANIIARMSASSEK